MTARVLFTGHAHGHVVCFRPLYEYLRARGDVHVFVSGGLPVTGEPGVGRGDMSDPVGLRLDPRAMARPFYIPRERVVTVEEMAGMAVDLLVTADSRMVRPRSVGRTVQLFPGLSFRAEAIRTGADAFFLVGPTMRRRLGKAGLLAADDPRGLAIGAPWTDRLVDGSLERDVLLRWYGLDGDRPILLYAPTGEPGGSLELMGEEVLARLDETDRYTVLVMPDRPAPGRRIDWAARLRSYPWHNVIVLDDIDRVPPLHMADLLITDASPIAAEYALLDRPMVFLDVPELVARVVATAGSDLDLASWARGAGTVIAGPEEVTAAVAHGLARPRARSAVRRATAADHFYNPGRATRTAADWLDRALARRGRTAA